MSSRRPRRSLTLAVLLVSLLSGAWALVSPLGSVPDEPAHVIYAAAVVRGQVGSGANGRVVDVPAAVAGVSVTTCPAFRPFVTADCIPPIPTGHGSARTESGAGRYPPLYYALVGWPTWFGFDDSVWYAMRLLSCLLAGGLLWLASRTWTRDVPAVAGGLVLAGTPMTSFMSGSVNPNGTEIAAGIAVALAGTGVLDQVRRGSVTPHRAVLGLSVPVVYLALARPGSHLLLIALVGVLGVVGCRELAQLARARSPVLVRPGLLAVAAVAFAVLYGRLGAVTSADGVADPVGARAAIATVARGASGYLLETVGIFGWRDHAPPLQLQALWIGMTAALVVAAWFSGQLRERLGLALLLVGSLVVAPVFVFLTLFRDGVGYQARYAMALVEAAPIIAGSILARRGAPSGGAGRRSLSALPYAALLVQLLVLTGSWLRYAVGLPLQFNPVNSLEHVYWIPPAWPVVAVLAAAACVMATGLRRRTLAPESADVAEPGKAVDDDSAGVERVDR